MRSPLARLRFALDHRWSQAHMSDYVDAEMAAGDRVRVERHTDDCPECRALLAALEAIVATLAALPARPATSVAAAVLAGVRKRLDAGDD